MTLRYILKTSSVAFALSLLGAVGCGSEDAPPTLVGAMTPAEAAAEDAKNGKGGAAPDNNGGGPSIIAADEEELAAAGGGATISEANVCAGINYEPESPPVDIYVMLDKSVSMKRPLAAGSQLSRWEGVVDALRGFVQDPRTADMGIGLQYFGTGESSCDPMKYATPEVPIGRLPGVAAAIEASLDKAVPSTLTPTYPALEGALMHAQEFAKKDPTRQTIVLLMTDGLPYSQGQGDCNDSVADVAKLAVGPANSPERVRTYLVGVADGLANLETIAQAGLGEAFFIESTDIKERFVEAMLDIKAKSLECDFDIPTPKEGEPPFDPARVNLEYTDDKTGLKTTVTKVDGESSCAITGKGWYFDNDAAPEKIFTCQQTCDGFARGRLKIVFGCAYTPPMK